MAGPSIIQEIMGRLGFGLTDSQASELWAECCERLIPDAPASIEAVDASTEGFLRSRSREIVMDALAAVLCSAVWPNEYADEVSTASFFRTLSDACKSRNYKVQGS